jgi:hydrogenase nickel incorporation protein HypA/HybF
MHELALAANILDIVCQSAKENDLERVTGIWVASGELMGVVFDALEFGFEIASSNTVAAGAKLNFRELPAIIRCDACGNRYLWKTHGYTCPRCSHLGGEMIQGKEFYIDYIEGDRKEDEKNGSD